VGDLAEKPGVLQLPGRHVDADAEGPTLGVGLLPTARVRTRGFEHLAAQLTDEPGFLRDRDERVGHEKPALGVLPSDERFDAGGGPGGRGSDRLVADAALAAR